MPLTITCDSLLEGKIQTFRIPKLAAPYTVCFTCFRHLEVFAFQRMSIGKCAENIDSSCHVLFFISLYTKLVHLNSCDLGFSFGQRAGQKVAELQWASIGAFLLRRQVIPLFIFPFFQKTVIETKLQQLVKHFRTSTRFYPALIFRLQLLQINARPQMVAV